MTEKRGIDLERVFSALKERWYICLLSLVVCVSVGAYITLYSVEPVYVASSTIFVSNDAADAKEINNNNLMIAEKMAKDCQYIAKSNAVLQEVEKRLPNVKVQPNNISVTLLANTRILQLTVQDANPQNAANIANAVTDVLIVEAQKITKIENMQPIDRAVVPSAPSTSHIKIYLLLAAASGIFLGVGIILLIEVFDKTIRGPEDVTEKYDLPILALVPKITAKDRVSIAGKDGDTSNA